MHRSIIDSSIGDKPYFPPIIISMIVLINSHLVFTGSPFSSSILLMFKSNGLICMLRPGAILYTVPLKRFANTLYSRSGSMTYTSSPVLNKISIISRLPLNDFPLPGAPRITELGFIPDALL